VALGPRSYGDQVLLFKDCLVGGAEVPLVEEHWSTASLNSASRPLLRAFVWATMGRPVALLEVLAVVAWVLERGDLQVPSLERVKIDSIPE
jgi:hypothetical protein